MITWMQRNKKYLIITIWVGVISFVAASMVGWGQYSFSLAHKVASVGNITITSDDLNREYSILYDEYNENYKKATGKPLDREQASLFKLEEQAVDRLINKALMINFALDYGLSVSDEEVAKYIQGIQSFKENNTYSPSLYKEILRRNRIKPSEYEERVREGLLLDKIVKVFNAKPTPIEKIVFSLPEMLKDDIEIKIVSISNINNKISDKELMDYYENNKNQYLEDSFSVEEVSINVNYVNVEESDLKAYYEDNKSNYIKDDVIEEFANIKDIVKRD